MIRRHLSGMVVPLSSAVLVLSFLGLGFLGRKSEIGRAFARNLERDSQQIRRVVVKGVGISKENAFKRAKAEALRQAFGMYGAYLDTSLHGREADIDSTLGILPDDYFVHAPEIRDYSIDANGEHHIEIEATVNVSVVRVETKGRGTTRDEAIQRAQSYAVENIVGVYVSSDAVLSQQQLISDHVYKRAAGYIRRWGCIRVSGSKRKSYRAHIWAEVVPYLVKEALVELRQVGVLVCVKQGIEVHKDAGTRGEIETTNWIHDALTADLGSEGYNVSYVPHQRVDQIYRMIEGELGGTFGSPSDLHRIHDLSLASLTDVLVLGKVDVTVRKFDGGGHFPELTKEWKTAEGSIRIKALHVDKSGEIKTVAGPISIGELDGRGIHKDTEKAIQLYLVGTDRHNPDEGGVYGAEIYPALFKQLRVFVRDGKE